MRILAIGLLAFGLAVCGASAQSVPVNMKRVWCAHGFVPGQYESFCLEELKEYNGLSREVWLAIEKEIIRGMQAKGYRYEPNTGQLQVSYGAFPPNDVSHPEVGLFLKLRVGKKMLDLTKWSVGAMAEAPYVENTMVTLAAKLTGEVPQRSKP